MKNIATLLLLICPIVAWGQTDVRAWYADGQVWVVWQETPPEPGTYAIYAKNTAFTDVTNAALVGRLFPHEWKPGAVREQIDPTATYRVPNEQGGVYQLAPNEGLFVFTPHQAGAAYVAVVKYGQTAVTPGVNGTANAVPFAYDPVNDPVECHFQRVFTTAPAYVTGVYYMWADGRQNHWEGRPDFPVTANAAKNGMPCYFLVSAPNNLDTVGGIAATVWLHGGGGTALQSTPLGRPIVNIRPEQGLLVAHNDDMVGYIADFYTGMEGVTIHFGWRKHYDPFLQDVPVPVPNDTVINYTQRKYIWIDQWLVRRFNVDPRRISINGHSMGAAGTTALAKAYPDHYASATIFNNGFDLPVPGPLTAVLFGTGVADYPTNLRNRAGQTVPMGKIFSLTADLSATRDLPLIRSFHSKNDDVGEMRWDSFVVAEYRTADSLAHGMQLYWSERSHGIDTGPDFDDHWVNGNAPTQQTVVDNVAYEEAYFRSDRSYPAFFNHRLDPANNDPGDGTVGTGPQGTGDDWGTWGGYHRWSDVEDEPGHWAVTAWLENNAVFANDNSPHTELTADVAVRRAQQFAVAPGPAGTWAFTVTDATTGELLQSGPVVVTPDSVAVIPAVVVYRDDIRRVRIEISPFNAAHDAGKAAYPLTVQPVPAHDHAWLRVECMDQELLEVSLLQSDGRPVLHRRVVAVPGSNTILLDLRDLAGGLYLVRIAGKKGVATRRVEKW